MVITDATLPALLKLLADPTRLRILALLEREELAVGELSRAHGMAQSRVSNHLRILRENHLLAERHAGVTTYLQLAPPTASDGALGRIWAALRDELENLPEHAADLVRLESELALRRSRNGEFFDRIAGDWDTIAGDFKTGQGRMRAVHHLLPADLVMADLGCGTGYMSEVLLGQCGRLLCIDASEGMLDEAKKRLSRNQRGTEVEYRRGKLDDLPVDDDQLDGLIAGMVLHHLPTAEGAVLEMIRVLKPGGSAAIMELAPHRETWMRDELGDRHLGLEPSDILATLRRAGFVDVTLDPLNDRYQPTRPDGEAASLPLYIVRGRKPRSTT